MTTEAQTPAPKMVEIELRATAADGSTASVHREYRSRGASSVDGIVREVWDTLQRDTLDRMTPVDESR